MEQPEGQQIRTSHEYQQTMARGRVNTPLMREYPPQPPYRRNQIQFPPPPPQPLSPELLKAIQTEETPDPTQPGNAPAVLPTKQAHTATGDMSAYQMHTPASSLPQGVAMANSHGTQKPPEEVTRKRELRLMKNREAARECRRKKKEYVKCLENRVAVLENQNNTLIEELRALKDIYRHKAEVAAKEHRRRKRDYLINLEALLAQLEAENKRLTAKLQYFQNTYGLQ